MQFKIKFGFVKITGLLLLLLCSNTGFGQTGILRGTVTDSTGAPFEGVNIILTRYNQKDIILVTDGHGRFLRDDLPAGIYDLVVIGQGYDMKEVRGLVIFEGGIVNEHINLSRPWRRPEFDDGYGRLPGDCE